VRRIRLGLPVLAGVILSLAFPPLLLVWGAGLCWRRLRSGSWGMTLAFLSRSGRRAFVSLAAIGLIVVTAAYASAIAGHGGSHIAPVAGTLVALGLLALVAADVVLGGAIAAADAATRPGRRR
jgi:hypothetical protein